MNLLDRPRRLRATPAMRELTAETTVEARHLITPHFVVEGSGVKEEIGSMPGVFHVSVDELAAREERVTRTKRFEAPDRVPVIPAIFPFQYLFGTANRFRC